MNTLAANNTDAKPLPQPKRILGIMPNYRAVKRRREAAASNTTPGFRHRHASVVRLLGLCFRRALPQPSLKARGRPIQALGKGIPGFWAYSWRGWVDKHDGNYWVVWALPTVLHEDERYCALGS